MECAAVFSIVLAVLSSTQATVPSVNTEQGQINGYTRKSFSGRDFFAFSGIPYAKPPVGELRFKDPVPIGQLTGVLNATEEGEDCVQVNRIYNKYPVNMELINKQIGSEDCLYLNVYTPQLKPEKPLPVMFYVHGGALIFGSGSSMIMGPEYLLDKDVVLVTINYRLGNLGFLSYDDEVIPGNLGMKDQVTALKWVSENIAAFGGDPGSVTVFGNSAGALSTHLLMHSPLTKGLFHRGITQSGTLDCSWGMASKNSIRSASQEFVKKMNCPTEAKEVLKCLQSKPVEEIFEKGEELKMDFIHMLFKPVLEKDSPTAFITSSSIKKRSKLPWITGVNSAEGLIYFELGKKEDLEKDSNTLAESLSPLLYWPENVDKYQFSKAAISFYFKNNPVGLDRIKAAVDMMSDRLFCHGSRVSERKHKGELYKYFFSHEGEKSFSKATGADQFKLGANHADETLYLFYNRKMFPEINFNESDLKVQKLLIETWTNFATYGNPTPKNISKEHWKKGKHGDVYAEITPDGLKMGKHLYEERMNFWDQLLAEKNQVKEEL